jgi:drug/metabolite transporter (DMT)-like permease
VSGQLSSVIAVVTAVSAALVFGVASVADQRSTKRVKRRRALSPRIFLDLVRQPLWLASIGGTVLGFALQVVALRFGPLALVEPLLVCDLIFAVLINAYLRRRWDTVLLGGVVAAAVGVAGFLAIAQPTSGQSSVGFQVVLPLAAGLTAAVIGCLAVARRNENLRPLALALACGINYGVAAFLVKLVVSDVSGGLPALLSDWPIYALAVVGPLGFLLNENAFQQGTLIAPVLSIITVCDPLISIALAYLWLNEKLSSTPAAIAGEVASLALMITGVVVVAHRAPHITQQADNTSRQLISRVGQSWCCHGKGPHACSRGGFLDPVDQGALVSGRGRHGRGRRQRRAPGRDRMRPVGLVERSAAGWCGAA